MIQKKQKKKTGKIFLW